MLGVVYPIPPEAIDAARTRMVDAGAIRIGIERRTVDAQSLRASYSDRPELAARLEAILGHGEFADFGVSLHVFGADDGHEYLRFDCFADEPHYHYIHRVEPGVEPVNHWVPFDAVACGDMVDWALSRIRTRLPEMLRQACGAHLVPRLDLPAITHALAEVERQLQAEHA